MIDPASALAFSLYENKGVFALLLGSGVSRASQIPTGWEIILDLTRRVGLIEGVEEQLDWSAWYRLRFGKEPNYSELLDAVSRSPDERRSILHHYIEPTADDRLEGRKLPTAAHRAIAKLVRDGFVRVIITTNFDRLLENALRDEGVEPTVIKSDDDLAGAVPLIHARCYIIKIHGDYLDTRIRNTEEELHGYSEAMNVLLDRIMDEHGLVVCGWSADWDHALRAVITRAPNRRYPLYWASRGDPSAVALDLIQHRQGCLVPIENADSFFEGLHQKVEAQVVLQRTNPRSLELLVANAKRYMAKPEYRISLHDLVREEVKRLQEVMAEPDLGAQGAWSPEEFRRRVARIEAACEPLIRLFTTLGRWGDDSELALVTDILKTLGKQRTFDGLVAYIGLRTYPAVLMLYAYGLSLTQSERYETLLRWFSCPIERESRSEMSSAVQQLFLWDWEGGNRDYWINIEGLDRHRTPLSDHLLKIMQGKTGDLVFDEEDFVLLFERFEIMGSLANATLAHTEADLAQALIGDAGRGYARIPVGRSSWHSQGARSLNTELSQPELRRRILAGGFAKGREEHLDVALQNIGRINARERW